MKKTLSMFLGVSMVLTSFALVLPVFAVAPAWDTTGNYIVTMEYNGSDYNHDMTLVQDGLGNLTGNGGSPVGANTYLWTINSGTVVGNEIDFTANYTATPDAVTPQTTITVEGTIAPNGTMSGTWSDNYAGGERLGTWSTQLFQVEQRDTEGELIYKLGNGQWDIPALRKLLEDILPKNTFFKGFEVEHNFPSIIMIAMEDVSEIMTIVSRLAQYTNQLEETLTSRTKKLEEKIVTLEKSIRKLGKK